MPAEHDLDPPAMTEAERLAKRRYHAYFAFETMPSPAEGNPPSASPTAAATSETAQNRLSPGDGPVHPVVGST